MNAYSLLLTAHLIVCILGVGSSFTIATLSRSESGRRLASSFYRSATRIMSLSLLFVVLSGMGLVALKDEGQFRHWWFRSVFFLTIGLGALAGTSLRGVTGNAEPLDTARLHRLTRSTWTMAGLTAVIVFLLENKPF